MNPRNKNSVLRKLIKMMELHLKTLEASAADEKLIEAYAAIIDFVDLEGDVILDNHEENAGPSKNDSELIKEARELSLDKLESVVSAEEIPKKTLELIAIYRFGVPKGSLRSIGTKENLRDKLLMMIGNQRVHQTIGEVAKTDYMKRGG